MTTTMPTTTIDNLIKKHKEEVAALRAKFGDPHEALSRFVIEHFDPEAFLPDSPSSSTSPSRTLDDDEDSDAW